MRPFIIAAVLVAGSALLWARQPEDKVVPVHEEPRHHLVFDTPLTKILDVQIHPGDTTLFHTHSDPILYVTMSTSTTRSQTLGREWSGGGTAAAPGRTPPPPVRIGRTNSVTTYATEPLTHRVNNVGQTLFRLIGITNATAGEDGTAPSADFAGKPEVDNRWFRSYRVPLTRGKPLSHRHANPVAIVLISDAAVIGAAATTMLDRPGTFAWVDADVPHTLDGRGDNAEIVEVEVRRP